jgi:hypothetical protein
MKELVFLLENKRSAEEMLKGLLPKIVPPEIGVRFIPFEGKQDLEKQLVRKLRGYRNDEARFIVMRDLDSNPDCRMVKNYLLAKCAEAGKADVALVRLACRELESFYLADLAAVEAGLGLNGLQKQQKNHKYRSPDYLSSPSNEIKKLTRNLYQKGDSSRRIGAFLDPDNIRSDSFRNLVSGIRRHCQALAGRSPKI